MNIAKPTVLSVALFLLPLVSPSFAQNTQPKNAEPSTVKANHAAAAHLPANDGIEEQEAHRGFIARLRNQGR